MNRLPVPVALLAGLLVVSACPSLDGTAPPCRAAIDTKTRARVAFLIDRLADLRADEVDFHLEGGSGLTRHFWYWGIGNACSPTDSHNDGDVFWQMRFGRFLNQDDPMRQLVLMGADALPQLLAHLGDTRKTGLQVRPEGRSRNAFLFHAEALDFNAWTDPPPVKCWPVWKRSHDPYRFTVGDLCFVAIGQIVNRDFCPRGSSGTTTVINSPTLSPTLRRWTLRAWGGLTREQHKVALIADILKPDSDQRQCCACALLAHYYPEALESLAPKLLSWPTYSTSAVDGFLAQVQGEKDPRKRQALFNAFVKKHGEAARQGVEQKLFEHLRTPHTDRWPRQLLVQLCGWSETVQSTDVPFSRYMADTQLARLLRHGLFRNTSPRIDRAVRDLLRTNQDNDPIARACCEYLLGRGHDGAIEAYARRRLRNRQDVADHEAMRALLNRLGWTRLHLAVQCRHDDVVRKLLTSGEKLDARSRNGQSPLHLAATAGDAQLARLLVNAGASINIKDRSGTTPMELAARRDHVELVRWLASRGGQPQDIFSAAILGQAERIEKLLRKDRDLVKAKTAQGRTPLHLAAVADQARAAAVLLAHGASPSAMDDHEDQVIHTAAWSGSDAVLRVLLRAGVSPRTGGFEPLHCAAAAGQVKVVRTLLDRGVPIQVRVKNIRDTPLHLAAAGSRLGFGNVILGQRDIRPAAGGHAEVVRLLLARGARPDGAGFSGETPLLRAVKNHQVDVAAILLAGGARVNAREQGKPTALHLAVESGNVPMALLLMHHGADRNARDGSRRTPLGLARESKNKEIQRLLEGTGRKR